MLLGSGAVVLLVTVVDVLWTTLAVGGAGGPLTGPVTIRAWALFLRIGGRNHRFLEVAGLALTLAVILQWIVLLLLGWTLVFLSDADAVVSAENAVPADGWTRFYYVGFTVFTLGNGDFVAGTPVWRVATVLTVGSALFLISLAITYLVSVTTSVTQKRGLAGYVSAIGSSPDDILVRAWDGRSFDVLRSHIQELTPAMSVLAQEMLAYPVLHYFHSSDRRTAAAPSIALVDELLTILEHGIVPERRLPDLVTAPLRGTVTELLETLASAFAEPGEAPPPAPSLAPLRRAGLPVVPDEEFAAAVAELRRRRQLLLGLVENDGWDWDSVWPGPPVIDEALEQRPQ